MCHLLGVVFGLDGSEESEYLRNTAVRIALDPIADEVTKRKQEGKVPPSLEELANELTTDLALRDLRLQLGISRLSNKPDSQQ